MSALSSSSPRKFNVAVGSGNPAKVESVRLAMQDAFPDAELHLDASPRGLPSDEHVKRLQMIQVARLL